MKFVLAPDSFKESMSAKEACNAMERGIKKVIHTAECIKVPMADGGEGTVEALVESTNGKIETIEVTAPLGNKLEAFFGVLGDGKTAVIEMAAASGIQLVKREERNPLITTTYGTGELIKRALDMGIKNIIIGIGGSATNDGGAGMLQALGVRLLDNNGNDIRFGGGALEDLATIDMSNLDERIKDVNIEVACDVTNPLVGENGASKVFGPQKGATPERVVMLDANLAHYANIIKRDLGKDIANVSGAGAAGGLGAALLAFLNAELKSGIDLVIKYSDLLNKVKDADYVLTGEGSIDFQTVFGKTPVGVAKVAKVYNIPVVAFAGRVGDGIGQLYAEGIDSVFGILNEVSTLDKALQQGSINLEKTVENVTRLIKLTN